MTTQMPASQGRGLWGRASAVPVGSLLLLVAVLPTACWVFYQSQRLFRADWASMAARQQVVEWASGASLPKTQQDWDAAWAALQRSISITPDDPDLYDRMGDLYAVAGRRDAADAALRTAHFTQAAQWYRKAIALRPSEPGPWVQLAAALQVTGAPPADVNAAWAKAQALGPFEGHVQPVLMQVALAGWDAATPEMQAWAKALFDAANEGTRRDINALALRYGLAFTPDAPPTVGDKP